MSHQHLSLAIVFSLTVCGCSSPGGVSSHPKVTANQIEHDVEAGISDSGPDGVYRKGEIEILESNYSDDKATVVLTAGSINVGSLAPADIENLKPEIRPQVASIDTIPYRLRLNYQWARGEWKLRRLDNLTFENQ